LRRDYDWTYEERNSLAIPLPFAQLADSEQQALSQFLNVKVVNFIKRKGMLQQFAWETGTTPSP